MNFTTDHPHRPDHPARCVCPPARRRRGDLPARVGRARTAGPILVRRLRAAARRARGGGDRGRAGRRLPRLRPRGRLEPTVPLPGRGARACRRAASWSPTRSSASTTPPGSREVLCGDAGGAPARPRRPRSGAASRRAAARARPAHPGRCEDYERGVARAKEHIRAGDVFQVVLSQRAERPTSAGAFELYRTLRRVNPSPYLFLLELGDVALIGSSPETLVKAEGRRASLNPIAGTTRPGPGDAGAPARVREGPRRARDARRPRPQRPLARLPLPAPFASSGSWSRSASRTSPTSSPRSSASCGRRSGRSTCCGHASRPARSPARRRCGRCS